MPGHCPSGDCSTRRGKPTNTLFRLCRRWRSNGVACPGNRREGESAPARPSPAGIRGRDADPHARSASRCALSTPIMRDSRCEPPRRLFSLPSLARADIGVLSVCACLRTGAEAGSEWSRSGAWYPTQSRCGPERASVRPLLALQRHLAIVRYIDPDRVARHPSRHRCIRLVPDGTNDDVEDAAKA